MPPDVTESNPTRAQLYVDVLPLFRAARGLILTCAGIDAYARGYTPGLPSSIKEGLIVCLVRNSLYESALAPVTLLHEKQLQNSVDCSSKNLFFTRGPQVDCTLAELSWAWLQTVG